MPIGDVKKSVWGDERDLLSHRRCWIVSCDGMHVVF